ncbi:hypothetical protein MYFR107205_28565 [Mycolicibacterium frederiksbergense]
MVVVQRLCAQVPAAAAIAGVYGIAEGSLDMRVRGTRLVVQSLCDLGLVGRGPL